MGGVSTDTHGHHASVLRSHSWRTAQNSASYLLAHVRGDERLLDVGTGPGTIAADLAGHVSDLTVTEVGLAELDLARATLAKRGVEGVHFEVQDIHALT